MIYCPQCGTANKPNSKFCKNCAALLAPSTDVRCPICGTMNPAGAATCSNCDTRLTTTSATPSDRTTPADTPENITPFTPPDTAPEDDDSDSARTISSSSARPSFSRSSSEWLRRVQKTPPADSSSNSAAAAMMAAAASRTRPIYRARQAPHKRPLAPSRMIFPNGCARFKTKRTQQAVRTAKQQPQSDAVKYRFEQSFRRGRRRGRCCRGPIFGTFIERVARESDVPTG